nr:hypothetical protein GCM10025732_30720 [Glycomyces mayteni]
MNAFPDPLWPVLVLAAVSFGDALLCIKPVPFVAKCFEDVGFPAAGGGPPPRSSWPRPRASSPGSGCRTSAR